MNKGGKEDAARIQRGTNVAAAEARSRACPKQKKKMQDIAPAKLRKTMGWPGFNRH